MLRIYKRGLLLLALTLAAIVSEAPSRAASRLTEDLTELLKMSDAVVQVTVTAQRVQAGNPQNVPFTVAALSVEKVYKGPLAAGATIQAEYIGGAAYGGMVVSPGQPHLNTGERAVLLLAQVPGAKNWRVLGGDAGQIVLARDGSGTDIARRGSGRFEFYISDEGSLTGYRSVKGAAIHADQLGALLQAALDTGRPVLEKEQAARALPLPAANAIVSTSEPSGDSTASRIFFVLLATTLVWAGLRHPRRIKFSTAGCRNRALDKRK